MSSVEYITSVLLTSDTQPEISNIPQNYTDLIFNITYGLAQANDPFTFRVGNTTIDTATNYSNTTLYANGSAVGSYRDSGSIMGAGTYYYGASTAIDHVTTIHIMSYSNSNTFKTILATSGGVNRGVEVNIGLWRSTSPITVARFGAAAGLARNVRTGSTITLWGVK